MLYPTNIIIKRKQKVQIVKEKIKDIKNEIKRKVKYMIFDRKNLGKIILIKLHI